MEALLEAAVKMAVDGGRSWVANVCGTPGLTEAVVVEEKPVALRRASVDPIPAAGPEGGNVNPRMAPGNGSVYPLIRGGGELEMGCFWLPWDEMEGAV